MLQVKYYTQDPFSEYNIWADEILKSGETLCGLDQETTVISDSEIDKLNSKYPSIVQISIRKDTAGSDQVIKLPIALEVTETEVYTCYIFHVKRIWLSHGCLPENLVKLFNTKDIIKTGADINTDVVKLESAYNIKFNGVIDIQSLSVCRGDYDFSLDTLSKKYLRLNKANSNLGDYDNTLTDGQILYAAFDAYLSLAVCRKMLSLDKLIPLFYRGETPEENTKMTSKDANLIYNFIKEKLYPTGAEEYPFETLYNVVYNSSKLWPKNRVNENLNDCLNILISSKMMMQNPASKYWRLYSDTKIISRESIDNIIKGTPRVIEDVRASCEKIITTHGISRSGLLNSLDNSLPKFNADPEIRRSVYGTVIDILLYHKRLSISNNGKIYYIKDNIST